ncbi:MAG TPA: zinc ribbon domain-containing protein, partial [Pirellulales bacterium]|nr:zinc ribbon domain-containing protein [Pirellulales bacterium]
NSYLLSGILRCGDCGARVFGKSQTRRGKVYRYYACSSYQSGGICRPRAVAGDPIDKAILSMVHEMLLSGDALARLRAEIVRQSSKRGSRRGQPEIEREIAKLDKQIKRGTENLLLAESEDIPAAQELLREWRQRRKELSQELKARQKGSSGSPEELVERAMQMAMQLRERVSSGNQAVTRNALRQVFRSITIFWDRACKRGWRISRAVAEFADDVLPSGTEALSFIAAAAAARLRPVSDPGPVR